MRDDDGCAYGGWHIPGGPVHPRFKHVVRVVPSERGESVLVLLASRWPPDQSLVKRVEHNDTVPAAWAKRIEHLPRRRLLVFGASVHPKGDAKRRAVEVVKLVITDKVVDILLAACSFRELGHDV